jgi:hypothetical protein
MKLPQHWSDLAAGAASLGSRGRPFRARPSLSLPEDIDQAKLTDGRTELPDAMALVERHVCPLPGSRTQRQSMRLEVANSANDTAAMLSFANWASIRLALSTPMDSVDFMALDTLNMNRLTHTIPSSRDSLRRDQPAVRMRSCNQARDPPIVRGYVALVARCPEPLPRAARPPRPNLRKGPLSKVVAMHSWATTT